MYNGRPVIVLHERIFPHSGKMLAIQYAKQDGDAFTIAERKAIGIDQYMFVKESEITRCE